MPKTKKIRKNKKSLKNKIKLKKNKTQKNLKGGLNPKIFQIIFLLLISNITCIILSFEIKELIKNNNLTAFSENIKFQYQFEKVVDLSNLSNLSNISIYNNFLEEPNQKALIPYIRQHEFNTNQMSILTLTPDFNKILKSSLSIVNLNNPTIDSLVNGFVYMYQSIFPIKIQNVDMNSINTFNKFILDLIKNGKIIKLLNFRTDDKQLVTINMKNTNEDIINLEKIFYVINDYNIKLNLENKELLNQKYDKIIEFIEDKTYKEIYDNLNESNIVFPSSLDENIFDDIFKNDEINELKKNLTELEDMINNNTSNDEINNKFMEINLILKNNQTLVDEIKKLNQSNDDKIVKMNKIINFSVSLCTFLTKCISIMQLIIYILVVKIFIDLISSEPVGDGEGEEKTNEQEEKTDEQEEKTNEQEEKTDEQEEKTDEQEEKTDEQEEKTDEQEEGDGEEEENIEGDGEEEEKEEEGNIEGDGEERDFLSSIFNEPDLEEETKKMDEYLSSVIKDDSEETDKFDEYLSSIFDEEPVINDTVSPVIFNDPGDNFTSTVFDDTFPKEPSGFKKKIIKPKMTEDEKIKNMSEIMKKFFEYRRKQKLRELLKNRILREIEGRYDEGKKQNLLSKLNNVIKNDNDIMINKINGLNQEERNNFNEDIKASLAPMEQTDITDQIDKDTNNLIDEFDSNEPDNNSFEYINDKFNNFGLKLKPKLIKSKIRETYDMLNDKISQIMKMIIELEKMRKLDNLYKMKIKKLTDENLNIEEIEKYKNKKKNLDILYLNFPDNINKKIDELTDEEKKLLEEEIKKYLLDDQMNNEIDEDTNNLIDEFESNEPDDDFFEYLKTKFPEKEFNVRPKPINSKIRETHEILNDKIFQIMKMIIELEKIRKINNLYDRKIKKINQQLSDIQNKISTLNPLNENAEVIRNRVEIKDLTQKYNQYNKKQKYIIEKINLISKKLNSKIDELNDEEKKILEEEIKKYLSLEEYSMSDYLYDKYKEITENIKKWIEFTGTSIRNQIELNDWMKKLRNLEEENETTQTDKNLKIMEEIKKITDSLKDGIKESKTKIGNLISQMTEKEKNDIEIMEEDINKKKMDNMKNRYMNALRLVQNIESGILSLSS
jgi:hypothetical protein